jgi:uncharacterized protein YukE
MTNATALLAGLKQYHNSLDRHLADLNSKHQELENSWHRFSEVYEGDAANQFRANWLRTEANFNEYIEQTQKISKMLDERIKELEIANKPEGILR